MKIYCLCIVKNEDDILGEVVTDAASWADRIFVSDNQSTDDTALVIDELVRNNGNVVNAGPVTEPFSDDIRAKVFDRVRMYSRRGDWWCRLDADEFYIDNPREFLERLPNETDTVWSSHFQFYFTEEDALRCKQDPVRFITTPVRERLKYYRNDSSEIRFVKHTWPFIWYKQWPRFRCAASPRRIRVAHYQYRSPKQIVKRLETRRHVAMRTRGAVFPHEQRESLYTDKRWAQAAQTVDGPLLDDVASYVERVVPTAGLDFFADGELVDRNSDLRKIVDVWPTSIPFFMWKSYRVASALLSVRRLIPDRMRPSSVRK